jgi:lysophospholipase L1-like esterase
MARNTDTRFPKNISIPRPIKAFFGFVKAVLGWVTGNKHWYSIAAKLALFLGVGLLAVLSGIVFTPAKSVDTLGQHFVIRAATPSWSLTGHGEITVNTGHPQTFYLLPTQYYGPLRVHLSVDAPFQGSDLLNQAAINHKLPPEAANAFVQGFKSWLVSFALVTLASGLALSAIAAFAVLLFTGKRRKALMLLARLTVVVIASLALVATLFVTGSAPISRATSLDGLVGHSTLHLSAKPAGPKLTGYNAVSIGDSRAATQGGKHIKNATKEDIDCDRSSDSLAAQIGRLKGWRVLNLACSSATIAEGLMGPQLRGGVELLSQMSRVEQMTNLDAVFVTIGPNDLWWSRAIGLCYMADVCNDNLTTPDYQALLEQFKWNYHDLLAALQGLTNGPNGTHPKIVINGSYDVIQNGASCAATKGLSQTKIALLNSRNADLNQALQDGANLFRFIFIKPVLKTFCSDLSDVPGPEIRVPGDPNAFHPTDLGVSVIATDDVLALAGAADGIAPSQ